MRGRRNTPEAIMARLSVLDNGCREWTGCDDGQGYGRTSLNGIAVNVHRVVYEALRGPIPGGHHLDHLCRNRKCANPDHLEPVTPEENVRRGDNRNRIKANCPKCGGDYSVKPTRGERYCKDCYNAQRRAKWAEMRSQAVAS